MGLFNLFKSKTKTVPHDSPDEEYQLPELSRGQFTMTDELRRRKENEELKRKHGVVIKKEGDFV